MPYRITPLVKEEIYHVYNRSIAKRPIFIDQKNYQRAEELIDYYRYEKLPLRFSHFKRLPAEQKEQFMSKNMHDRVPCVEILAYCLMPNHIHFLLKQFGDNGISEFMSNLQNSYAKYFNIKHNRTGSLFQAMFKVVRVENDDQLLHVSRYIHLNPVTAYIINIASLEQYPWSSFKNYCSGGEIDAFVNTKYLLKHFSSKQAYKEFVYNQADYQRELDTIKHLLLE